MALNRLGCLATIWLWAGAGWLIAASDPAAAPPRPERIYLSYLRESVVRIPGGATGQDFLFRLPEHVRCAEGSALHVVLRGDVALWSGLCRLRVIFNGRTLLDAEPGPALGSFTNHAVWRMALPIEPEWVEPDWNRVTLRFVLHRPDGFGPVWPGDLEWEIRDADSFFALVYERRWMFPEPVRFPSSLVEEELLRSPFSLDPGQGAAVALLVPRILEDVHRRGVAVLGACLGWPGYLRQCEVAYLTDWEKHVEARNGIVLGLRSEVAWMLWPPFIQEALNGLAPGQGLVAEHVFGSYPHQRRWLLVSGEDQAGLEKALRTLSRKGAMVLAPPNPSIIVTPPPPVAKPRPAEQDGWISLPVQAAGGDDLVFRGLFDTVRSFDAWYLGPAETVGDGGYLELAFQHAPELLTPGSWLEATAQGQQVGRVDLTPDTAKEGRVRWMLPAGLIGPGPLPVQLRAHLDLSRADCGAASAELAWLRVSTDSKLVYRTDPLPAKDLSRAQDFLVGNPTLLGTVILIPANAGLPELQWLVSLMRDIGSRYVWAEEHWPEVIGYGPGRLPAEDRLRGRRVLLLGAVRDWPMAVAGNDCLVLRPGSLTNEVRVQGRTYRVDEFEPSLAVLHLVRAPWGAGDQMLVGGGWDTFALSGLRRMLTDPEAPGYLFGAVCAMDDLGRAAAYDARARPRESLGACLLRNIPPGLSLEETLLIKYRQETQARASDQFNFTVSVWMGLGLILLAGSRVWLLWERSRVHRRLSHETPGRKELHS